MSNSKVVSTPLANHFKLTLDQCPKLDLAQAGTTCHGIMFSSGNGDHSAVGCVDSDYVSDMDDKRSTTEHVFTLAGGPICWKSHSVIYLANNQVYHARTKHIDVRFHKIKELLTFRQNYLRSVKKETTPLHQGYRRHAMILHKGLIFAKVEIVSIAHIHQEEVEGDPGADLAEQMFWGELGGAGGASLVKRSETYSPYGEIRYQTSCVFVVCFTRIDFISRFLTEDIHDLL
ncbi:hypothetical protein L195_g012935 [Trifolium pratense]|uniref:Retrovirus-related Pol polyprotein from transposon TNT 1-94 n=1 Tax=Trifolium pratense TaxID=57577 RepID=A0A2K3PLS9_TRIPR|nr:hypothetical protein L195_g012935 [Trifolium pratense]